MDTFHICKTVRDIRLAESYEDKRDRLVAESMAHGGEFYPFAGRNFSEAIGEPDLTDTHFAIIGDFLRQGKDDAAIQYMRRVSVEYWTPIAVRQAEADLAEADAIAAEEAADLKADHQYQLMKDEPIDRVWLNGGAA